MIMANTLTRNPVAVAGSITALTAAVGVALVQFGVVESDEHWATIQGVIVGIVALVATFISREQVVLKNDPDGVDETDVDTDNGIDYEAEETV